MMDALRDFYDKADVADYKLEQTKLKIDVLMLGFGLFNLAGRQLWVDILSSLLYAHERQYKLKKIDFQLEQK